MYKNLLLLQKMFIQFVKNAQKKCAAKGGHLAVPNDADEFNKLAPGAVEASEDGLVIHGGTKVRAATCFSYDDHRMAMSLAILGAAGEGAEIERPECVTISYPAFYDTLARLQA